MKVVHIIDGNVVCSEVPENWIMCSISGEYRPPEEFRNEGEVHQSRTNCTRTYLMPSSKIEILRESVNKMKQRVCKMENDIRIAKINETAGIPILEYIETLKKFALENPSARIVADYDDLGAPEDLFNIDGIPNIFY